MNRSFSKILILATTLLLSSTALAGTTKYPDWSWGEIIKFPATIKVIDESGKTVEYKIDISSEYDKMNGIDRRDSSFYLFNSTSPKFFNREGTNQIPGCYEWLGYLAEPISFKFKVWEDDSGTVKSVKIVPKDGMFVPDPETSEAAPPGDTEPRQINVFGDCNQRGAEIRNAFQINVTGDDQLTVKTVK